MNKNPLILYWLLSNQTFVKKERFKFKFENHYHSFSYFIDCFLIDQVLLYIEDNAIHVVMYFKSTAKTLQTWLKIILFIAQLVQISWPSLERWDFEMENFYTKKKDYQNFLQCYNKFNSWTNWKLYWLICTFHWV